MKKTILFLLLGLTILSCDNTIKPGNMYYGRTGANDYNSTVIRYFQDPQTNLCFAERGVGSNYSFTCVECDSLVLNWIKTHK